MRTDFEELVSERESMRKSATADELVKALHLRPLDAEGGYYAETFRSSFKIQSESGVERPASTAIYYLLTDSTYSRLHRLRSDEVWHFYAGDPVEMVQLAEGGNGQIIVLGSDLLHGEKCQVIVPAGVWQGARLRAGGRWALMGCTVAPGFEFADFELADRQRLRNQYPTFGEWIDALT
jgi:uncharacterized protein